MNQNLTGFLQQHAGFSHTHTYPEFKLGALAQENCRRDVAEKRLHIDNMYGNSVPLSASFDPKVKQDRPKLWLQAFCAGVNRADVTFADMTCTHCTRLDTRKFVRLQNTFDNAVLVHHMQGWSHYSHRRNISVKHSDASSSWFTASAATEASSLTGFMCLTWWCE